MTEIEIRKSVGAVLFTEKEQIINFLLVKAGKKNYWEFPKGKQEEGESELETLKREIFEETGVVNLEIIDDFRFSYYIDLPNQKREIIYYLAKFKDDKIVISDEHADYILDDYEKTKSLLEIPKLIELLDLCKKKLNI